MNDYERCIDCGEIYEDRLIKPWCNDCIPNNLHKV